MYSWEALGKAINRKTTEFARALGLSSSMLHKWQEPTSDWADSGALNPLDRVEHIIERSVADGNSLDDALAPVYYLAERFGLIVIPAPQCKCLEDLQKELYTTIKEFGQLVTAASESMCDGHISRTEARRIEEEGQDLMRHVAGFIAKTKEAII